MKIEKVNDNQIRCTLTREDLADRELKISELAYGTEKAKSLFRDMMQQASYQFGFEAEDIPLMIEAIPLNSECIVLIITKVEDPEELDTRFSKFSPSVHDENENGIEDMIEDLTENTDEVLDLFKKLHEGRTSKDSASKKEDEKNDSFKKSTTSVKKEKIIEKNSFRIYSFNSLHEVLQVASVLAGKHNSKNSLYKDKNENNYILFVEYKGAKEQELIRVFHVLSEYGKRVNGSFHVNKAYYEEHADLILKNNALQSLAEIV